jgi:hypothetical protein
MKKWIIRKLIDLALWLDWREGIKAALAAAPFDLEMKAPRKTGRPLGSKDKKPRKSPARKVKP